MRTVPIDQVQEDDILAQNIYAINGLCLAAEGMKLKPKIIDRLKSMGYNKIAIQDDRFKDIAIKQQQALSDETKLKVLSVTKNVLNQFETSGQIHDVQELFDVVDDVLDEVLSNGDISVDITNVQSYDLGTYTHSLSVTVLSLYLAKALGFNRKQLKDIGIGGLLHDLGKIKIPAEILNKPGKLTKEEFDIVKKHPMDGYLHIKDKVNLLAAHIALQHHEKYDGTGYPRGLKGDAIHLYGRVTAVCDVYDAITMDRPYRPGMKPNEAIELMMSQSGTHFDPDIFKVFMRIIAPYPNGTLVRLSNGNKAIVTAQNNGFPLRPQVLIFEEANQPLHEYKPCDLCEALDISIISMEYK